MNAYEPTVLEMRKCLHDGECEVEFTKKNGERRLMRCTTNLDLIPPSGWPKGKLDLTEEQSSSNIRVYDLDAQGWRSFLSENMTTFKSGSYVFFKELRPTAGANQTIAGSSYQNDPLLDQEEWKVHEARQGLSAHKDIMG